MGEVWQIEGDSAVRLGGAVLNNVHDNTVCAGRPCVLHAPTDHHMRTWPLLWRDDRGIFERICTCLIGHPDPDQFAYWRETDQDWQTVHGCCGHCVPPGPA